MEKHHRRAQQATSAGTKPPGLDLLLWTTLHRRMLKAGTPLDFVRHSYLIGIYAETARRAVLYKAGQMGVSEYLVSYALHACDQRGATALYVFPTDTHVSDFSSARIGPAIEASPYLASIVVEGAAAGGKRGADRITLKRVRDDFLYLRGGQVDPEGRAPQLKSVDADVLVIDEWDEMDDRAPELAEKRLGHSDIAEVREASTPTYAGVGIHAEWQKSDQREWFVSCPHCGERQAMTIDQVVVEWDELERPVLWHGQAENRAWAACRKCGRELNRFAPGEWVATRPGVEIAGFHMTKFFNPTTDLLSIVAALQSVNETKRKECVNQDLGEPYKARGTSLTMEMLDACRRDYAHGPRRGMVCWMGVDVGSILHIVVRGLDMETGERPQLWAGAVESWDELGRTTLRFQPRAVVIDALPETTKAREFQASFEPGRVWLAYYSLQQVGSKLIEPEAWNWEKGVVDLDRTRTLDAMFADFLGQRPAATLPADAREVPDYYDHLQAPKRVLVDGPHGAQVARYVEAGKPDHFAHAENYCRVAIGAPRESTIVDDSMHVNIGY